MSRLYLLLVACCLVLSCANAQAAWPFSSSEKDNTAAAGNPSQFLPVDEAFQAYAWHDDSRVYVGVRARPGYYLYRQRFALESSDPHLSLGTLQMPAGTFKNDPYLGDVHIFRDRVQLSAPLPPAATADREGALPVTLSFQGCADAGLCYPPEHWSLSARAGSAPAGYTDASDDAQASPLGSTPASGNAPFAADPGPAPQADPIGAPSSPPAASAKTLPLTTGDAASLAPVSDDGHFQSLLRGGLGIASLGFFFLAGLGLTFTPCVLPMVPILTSIIVGQHAGRRRALVLSVSYVVGMALTFTLLGTLMGLFGASLNLQARLQSPWVLIPFALLFVLFACAMFGRFDLRLPNGLSQRADAWQQRLRRSGPLGLAVAGALSVLVVSPCVSAPLAGALVFISSTGDTVAGALALLALALGMGLPLILVGTFGTRWLPRTGHWMNSVKALFGVMLLGVAIWLIERLLPGPLALVLWGVLALGCAVALGPWRPLPTAQGSNPSGGLHRAPASATGGWPLIRQTAGWVLLVWGVAMVWGAAQGQSDPLRPLRGPMTSDHSTPAAPVFHTVTDLDQLSAALDAAREAGRPAMVDVSAEWCIACKVMEREVFPAPAVAARLADFALIRADVTDDVPASRELLAHYRLFGPPAFLFFAGDHELTRARVQGEMEADAFAAHLATVERLSAQD
ncbi:protein-disulfide reductase DsbD [Salinicola avicenniae]|uniref:protein-disulfide reductase DsbD n=1 Tax=Salinicola avicenniae TaxID=2916836 RepID=UPI002072BAEA|nr:MULTISPECIES: protein-disulfide reductase DsbD [unclassified Salinicola]